MYLSTETFIDIDQSLYRHRADTLRKVATDVSL